MIFLEMWQKLDDVRQCSNKCPEKSNHNANKTSYQPAELRSDFVIKSIFHHMHFFCNRVLHLQEVVFGSIARKIDIFFSMRSMSCRAVVHGLLNSSNNEFKLLLRDAKRFLVLSTFTIVCFLMRRCHQLFLLSSIKNIAYLLKFVKMDKILSASSVLYLSLLANEAQAKCTGRFLNPINDICWECLFPISIGGAEISQGIAPEAGNPSSPVCMCGLPVPRVGIAAGFWEQVRLVDVTKEPFCFPTLDIQHIRIAMTVNIRKLGLLGLMTLLGWPMQYSNAYDFGVVGSTATIEEEDMLDYIKGRLTAMQASGELDERNKQMQEYTQSKVTRPKSIEGISNATEPKSWLYDPTFTLRSDIKDENGNIIHHVGKSINPLDHMPLKEKLIFINGDDEAQVKWAINYAKTSKIILVNGSPQELMEENKVRFYFDQQGVLVHKFTVKQVPAIVRQAGSKLLIEEILIVGGE
jgi:conjugal transfer pilus assembly protein TraW